DPFIGEFMRLVFARFAIDAVRIDLAIVDAASLLSKAVPDVIAIGLDLPAHLDQRRAELRRRHRRHCFARTPDTRGHHRLFHRGVAAFRARDLAGFLLRLEPIPVTEPALEFVAVSATQREQDHRDNLRMVDLHPQRWRAQFSPTMTESCASPTSSLGWCGPQGPY